jgi:hypothetical protein
MDYSKFNLRNNYISHSPYFVSGHRDLTPEEFEEHYVNNSWLTTILRDERDIHGYEIVIEKKYCYHIYVGDCQGCDEMTIKYIYNYLMSPKNQYNRVYLTICKSKVPFDGQLTEFPSHPNIEVIEEFNSHEDRDSYMTEFSSQDIVWVREGKWDSGSAQNIIRREWHKPCNYIHNELAKKHNCSQFSLDFNRIFD